MTRPTVFLTGKVKRRSSNAYATYKLALLLFVAGRLGISLPFEEDVTARVWSMQNQTSGGIFTHITPDGTRGDSDTNTETTAFVILGMTSIQSERPITDARLAVESFLIAVAFVTLAIVIVTIRRKRRAT